MVSCALCAVRPECIRASSLARYDPKDPAKLRELVRQMVYRTPPDAETQKLLDEGKAAHAALEKNRGVVTDPATIIQKARARERFWFSLAFCSVRWALRGTVDAVLFEPFNNILRLTVLDDKTHISSAYFKQLWAYSLIVTDPNCLFTVGRMNEDKDAERRRFYPVVGVGGFTPAFDWVEVFCTLNVYKGPHGELLDNPLAPKRFSSASVVEHNNKYQVFAILNTKQKILEAYYSPAELAASRQMRFHATNASMLPPRGRR
jgi:hypothetical protein